MRTFLLIAALSLLIAPALAQEQTPAEQAMSEKLLAEVNAGLSCSAAMIAAKRQVALLNIRIKELEAAQKPQAAPAAPPN